MFIWNNGRKKPPHLIFYINIQSNGNKTISSYTFRESHQNIFSLSEYIKFQPKSIMKIHISETFSGNVIYKVTAAASQGL